MENKQGFITPLVLMLLVQSLTAAASQAIPVLATDAAGSFGIAKEHVGFFISISYLVAMVSSLAGGSFAGSHGAMRVSQACLLLCAASLLAFATGMAWLLIPAAILMGIGYGPATPASSQILARVTPRHLMNLVFSIKQTGVPIGGIVAGAVVAPIIVYFGWRGATVAVAIACILIAVLLQPLRRRLDTDLRIGARPSVAHLFGQVKAVLQAPLLRSLSLISIAFSATQVCLSTYLVLLLIDNVHMELIAAGLILTVTQTAGVVGRIVWGSVADRTGRPLTLLALLAVGMTAGAISLALVDAETPTMLIIAVAVLFGGTAIGWNGVFLAEVARLAPPGRAGETTGGTSFFTFSGPLIGPALFGLILWLTGSYAVGFCVLAFFTATAAFVLMRAATK